MLDFPSNPSVGDTFQRWEWNGERWGCGPRRELGFPPPPPVFVGSSAPANPATGDLWWNTVSRTLSIYEPYPLGPFSWINQEATDGRAVFGTAPRIDIGPLTAPSSMAPLGWYINGELYSPNPFLLSARLTETSAAGAAGRTIMTGSFSPASNPSYLSWDTQWPPTGSAWSATWPGQLSRLTVSLSASAYDGLANRSFALVFTPTAPSPWRQTNWAAVDGRGVTDGSNSVPGLVGESQSRAGSMSDLGTGTTYQDTLFVFGAGDWDCSAHGRFTSPGNAGGGGAFGFLSSGLDYGPGTSGASVVTPWPLQTPWNPAASRFVEAGVPSSRMRRNSNANSTLVVGVSSSPNGGSVSWRSLARRMR